MAKYNASSIKVLSGLEPARKNPGMYIGPTDAFGLYQIWKEAIDNGGDEAMQGYGDTICVAATKEGHYWTWDQGRGVPVDKHKEQKRPAVEVVFTTLHAGSKFDEASEAYKKGSAGVHGVGAAVTNALSTEFEVWTYRDGQWYTQIYKKGGSKIGALSKCKAPKLPNGEKAKKGTVIRFVPDKEIFGKHQMPLGQIQELLEFKSYIQAGVKFVYYGPDGKSKTYHHPKGLPSMLKHRFNEINGKMNGRGDEVSIEKIGREPFIINEPGVQIAAQWTSFEDVDLKSSVSGSKTKDGGVHEDAFWKCVQAELAPFKGKREYRIDDLKAGVLGAINVNIRKPSFDSQTKSRLVSEGVTKLVTDAISKPLRKYFAGNKSMTKEILDRAASIRANANEFRASKKIAAALKNSKNGKSTLPAKLVRAPYCKDSERELFLVEGDSAGGPCKKARIEKYQEILPLRGKLLNVYKDNAEKALETDNVLDILKAIGFDPSRKDPMNHLRIGRLIILTDPDPDGQHITVLILSVINLFLPQMIEKKMVYMCSTELFNVQHNGQFYFGASAEEVLKKAPKGASSKTPQRVKGWGEVSPDLLRVVAFDPKSRRLIRIKPLKDKAAEKRFTSVVGFDTLARKTMLLESNA